MNQTGAALEKLESLRIERTADGGDANKVWYLRQNRLFSEASEAGVESCEHIFVMREMDRGTRIFDQGDPTRIVYLVKRGTVRIARETADGKDVTVALLGPGDIFGEEALFDAKPRTTVALVVEDALLCQARAEDLFGLLASDPTMALNVANVLNNRLNDATATMEDLAYARISDRIMNCYRKLAREHGVAADDGVRIDLRLTHADIASLVGSTRETVSVEVHKLIASGRLVQRGRSVIVPKAEL